MRIRVTLVVSSILLAGTPSRSSDLVVQGNNTRFGAFAARLTVSSTCSGPRDLQLSGPIAVGTHEACSTVRADGDVSGGSVTVRAGDSVIFENGFSVAAGAMLAVEVDGSLFPDAYVEDDTPAGEVAYSARFHADGSALSMNAFDRFYLFEAVNAKGDPQLRVGVTWNSSVPASERRLFLEIFRDNGGWVSTEGFDEKVLPSTGWHWIEVGWIAASAAGANDGMAYLCIDSLTTGCSQLGLVDNDQGKIEQVRLGAVGVSLGAFGQIDLDAFGSKRGLGMGAPP